MISELDRHNIVQGPARVEDGVSVYSGMLEVDIPPGLLEPVFGQAKEQFSRAVAYVALGGELVLDDSVVEYKEKTGWRTPEHPVSDEADAYWRSMRSLVQHCVVEPFSALNFAEYHDPDFEPVPAVLVEHTRRFKGNADAHGLETYPGTDVVTHEDDIMPTFSGTTNLGLNIPPGSFGPHLDSVHSSPALIGFIPTEIGAVVCRGAYPALQPFASKADLNNTGYAMEQVPVSPGKFSYGDARYLLHSAPSFEGWRDLIRFFIAPKHPRDL